MKKLSITEKKAKLEEQLNELKKQEKAELDAYQSALGAGLQSVFDADTNLKNQVMAAIDKNLKNNKQRALLGLSKLKSERGRPKAEA